MPLACLALVKLWLDTQHEPITGIARFRLPYPSLPHLSLCGACLAQIDCASFTLLCKAVFVHAIFVVPVLLTQSLQQFL